MTDSNKKSKTNSTNKTQDNQKTGQVPLSKAEMNLKEEIVNEAKKLALQKTSSAFEIIKKTRELLRIEDMQRPA